MDGWEAPDTDTEELVHNWSSRRERAMVAVGAVVLVGVSVLVGWRLGTSSSHGVTAPATHSPTSQALTADAPATRVIKLVASPFEPRVSPIVLVQITCVDTNRDLFAFEPLVVPVELIQAGLLVLEPQ